jgi:hypothetical protein
MILSVSVTITTIKWQNKWWWYCQCLSPSQQYNVRTNDDDTVSFDGDRHWQYHHLFWHFIVGMVTDTDSIIIICSDILLLWWWQTLTISSFVLTFYCCDGHRHWQYHHHLFWHFIVVMVTDTDSIIICSDILLLWWWQTLTVSSPSVSVTITTIKCPNK